MLRRGAHVRIASASASEPESVTWTRGTDSGMLLCSEFIEFFACVEFLDAANAGGKGHA